MAGFEIGSGLLPFIRFRNSGTHPRGICCLGGRQRKAVPHDMARGKRVARRGTDELGTIVEVDSHIKVQWDHGRTSYFRHGQQADVQLQFVEH